MHEIKESPSAGTEGRENKNQVESSNIIPQNDKELQPLFDPREKPEDYPEDYEKLNFELGPLVSYIIDSIAEDMGVNSKSLVMDEVRKLINRNWDWENDQPIKKENYN